MQNRILLKNQKNLFEKHSLRSVDVLNTAEVVNAGGSVFQLVATRVDRNRLEFGFKN